MHVVSVDDLLCLNRRISVLTIGSSLRGLLGALLSWNWLLLVVDGCCEELEKKLRVALCGKFQNPG